MSQTHDQAVFADFMPAETPSEEQIDTKAQELLAQLTLEEKISMMCGDPP